MKIDFDDTRKFFLAVCHLELNIQEGLWIDSVFIFKFKFYLRLSAIVQQICDKLRQKC